MLIIELLPDATLVKRYLYRRPSFPNFKFSLLTVGDVKQNGTEHCLSSVIGSIILVWDCFETTASQILSLLSV